MKSDTLLQWGGIAFIFYLGSSWLANRVTDLLDVGRPTITLGQVQWAGPLPISVAATVEVPVTNNNAVSFPLQRLLANIVYGAYVLSSLRIDEPLVIQAGQTTVLEFHTELSFTDIGGNIASIIISGEYLQALRLTGNAQVEGVTIPFNNTISVG